MDLALYNLQWLICNKTKQKKSLIYIYIYIYIYIGLGGRVFVNGLRDLGSIPGRVIPRVKE